MKTPLYDQHVRLGARMVDFSGWEMPLLYTGIIPEHAHTRTQVSLFDICHMGEFEVRGPTAEADLERLLTQPIAGIRQNAGAYGYLLDDQGGVIDDLICFRLQSDRFWLVVNAGTTAGDADWIREHLSAGTEFLDLSGKTAKLDIQGPATGPALEQLFPGRIPDLKYFRCAEVELNDFKGLLSRTGYTGEWGYEFYLPLAQAVECWRTLLTHPQIRPAGLGARDTLRVEMGYPLYGHELSTKAPPAGVAQGRFMDLSKTFIGRDAVQRALESEDLRVLTGLRMEGRMSARAGDPVMEGANNVGMVTSGLFAPSLGYAVALAYIDRNLAGAGQQLHVTVRGRALPAKITELPFYATGTARRAPPGPLPSMNQPIKNQQPATSAADSVQPVKMESI
ncbi:MAG: glycine cleavage system aminomethyltransferase GcvT [Kiritimatiellia bacterium]